MTPPGQAAGPLQVHRPPAAHQVRQHLAQRPDPSLRRHVHAESFTIRDWWAFAEVFGIPIRVGKYGPNATPRADRHLKNAIATIASDSGAIIRTA